jgi:hypothetical protein
MSTRPIDSNSDVRIDTPPEPSWERAVLQTVRGLRYGSVEVVVHDGRVVQIETREKVRFAEASARLPRRGDERSGATKS